MAFFGATTNCKGTDSGLQEDSDPAVDSYWYKFRDGTCSLASIPSYSTGTRPYPVYAPVGSQANSGCTWTSGYASPDVSSFGSDSEKQPGSESFTATVASQHEGGLRKQSSTSVVDVRFNWTLQLTSGDQSQGSPLSQCTIHYSPEVIIRQQLPKDMEPSTMPPPRAKDVSSHNAPEGSIAPEDHSHVMSPIHQEILQVFMPQLTQYMSPTALLPYLQRLDLLSPEDADFITNPLRTDLERRHRVLKRAPYRDPGAFERFVQCLSEEPEHPGHKYLARRLREAMLKKQQNPNAILRQTSSSESPQATSPELQRTPSRTCTRSHSTRSCYSDGSRRSRDESTSTATAKALPQQRKSHDSQLRDRGGVIPSIPPRPSRGAPQDSSRTLHQQIKDQVRAVVHNPTSPPYGMLPPTGPTTAAIPRSLPASPVLSRRPSHTFDYEDNFRSLRRVPRPAQGRKMSSADEKLNKKKLEWLQERVQFQENSEVVVFDSHTHCGHERRLLYSGVLQEHGKPRFVVLLNDMLLILKSRRRRASHLDWFSDQEFTARKPLLLHLLTLQKQTKKQHMCMYFKNQSELMEICLQACSEDAKKVWVEQLSEAITLSTAAHAGTVLSIGNKISKKHSGKPYTKVTLTELTVMELLLPKHCLRGQLYCVVGVGRQRCRTTGVSGGGILEWNIRCEFSDITRKDFLMIQLCRESTFRPDDLLGSVTIPLPTLTLEQPGPHVMEGQLPLLNREQAIIGTIALHAEIGWETKM